MKKQIIICPHCGKAIKITISKGVVNVDDSFFDIDASTLIEKLREAGIELAQKGGDKDG